VKRAGQRKLSATHKHALAEGRSMSATVNRYLEAVTTPKRRGRPVSQATLEQRLVAAEERFKNGSGVEKLLAAQEKRDIQARLRATESTSEVDVKTLEAAFVKIAKQFSENRGVTYGAWREAGVAPVVLKKAGIRRTRS
jgi:hypothetical protein